MESEKLRSPVEIAYNYALNVGVRIHQGNLRIKE